MRDPIEEGRMDRNGRTAKELVDEIYQNGVEAERERWAPLALAIVHTMHAITDFPDVPDKDDRRRLRAISGVIQRAHDLIPDVQPIYKMAREQEVANEAEGLLRS